MAKLPVLFQHYFEHKLINSEITFSEYLSDHYNSIPHTDNDEARDNQLPFKSLDLSNFFTPAIPIFHSNNVQKTVWATVKNDSFLYKENFIPSCHCRKVWQPPKGMIIS